MSGEILIYADGSVANYFTFFIKSLLLLKNSVFKTYERPEDIVIDENKIYIFIQLLYPIFYGKRNVYIFNTEQLTVEMHRTRIINVLGKNIIIDYNYENIEYLKRYVHLKEEDYIIFPVIRHSSMIYMTPMKIYDIAFIGGVTQRREQILKQLNDYKVLIITNKLDGEHMFMSELVKAKILLNIHAYEDRKITETIRCYPCLFNGILVVSEESYDMTITHACNPCNNSIHFTQYDNLVQKCRDVLLNYDELMHHLINQYDVFDQIGIEYLNNLETKIL